MSATEPSPTQRHHRERLLAALAESIRERGLRATQIADIVRAARTSRRTFYECFADKESCFVELVRQTTTELLAAIESSIDAAAPWPDQVNQAIDTYLDVLVRDPAVIATISRELPALGLRGAAVQRENIELFAALVVRLAQSSRARSAGLRTPSHETAIMLVGGLNELVIHAVERGQSLNVVAGVGKDVFKAALLSAPGADGAG
jgi:AcrR family transcriptional regulator